MPYVPTDPKILFHDINFDYIYISNNYNNYVMFT